MVEGINDLLLGLGLTWSRLSVSISLIEISSLPSVSITPSTDCEGRGGRLVRGRRGRLVTGRRLVRGERESLGEEECK